MLETKGMRSQSSVRFAKAHGNFIAVCEEKSVRILNAEGHKIAEADIRFVSALVWSEVQGTPILYIIKDHGEIWSWMDGKDFERIAERREKQRGFYTQSARIVNGELLLLYRYDNNGRLWMENLSGKLGKTFEVDERIENARIVDENTILLTHTNKLMLWEKNKNGDWRSDANPLEGEWTFVPSNDDRIVVKNRASGQLCELTLEGENETRTIVPTYIGYAPLFAFTRLMPKNEGLQAFAKTPRFGGSARFPLILSAQGNELYISVGNEQLIGTIVDGASVVDVTLTNELIVWCSNEQVNIAKLQDIVELFNASKGVFTEAGLFSIYTGMKERWNKLGEAFEKFGQALIA